MTETLHEKVDAIGDAAADWVVRLNRPTTGEADWLAFDAWLDASHAHAEAYDRAMGLWSEMEASAPRILAALQDAPAAARPASNRGWMIAGGLAAAALAVAVVPWADITAPTTVYQTAHGERRVVTLQDGTRIDLNAGSRLTVRLKARTRQVTMDDAEAVFDVAKDAQRPFLISVGDRAPRRGRGLPYRRRAGQALPPDRRPKARSRGRRQRIGPERHRAGRGHELADRAADLSRRAPGQRRGGSQPLHLPAHPDRRRSGRAAAVLRRPGDR
jgi:transmembrane sensor